MMVPQKYYLTYHDDNQTAQPAIQAEMNKASVSIRNPSLKKVRRDGRIMKCDKSASLFQNGEQKSFFSVKDQ